MNWLFKYEAIWLQTSKYGEDFCIKSDIIQLNPSITITQIYKYMIYSSISSAIVCKKCINMVNKRYGFKKLSQMHLLLMFAFCVLHRHGKEITTKRICAYVLKYDLGSSSGYVLLNLYYLISLGLVDKDCFLRNTRSGMAYKVNVYKVTPLLLEYMRDLELQMRRAYVSV